MRNIISILSLLLLSHVVCGQLYSKKDLLIEGNYGSIGAKRLFTNSSIFDYGFQSKLIGPISLKAEYLLHPFISVGLELGYINQKIVSHTEFYTDEVEYNDFCSMIIGNYHFIQRAKFEFNVSTGLGYMATYHHIDFGNPYKMNHKGLPSYRFIGKISIGTRYFFTPCFGLNFNLNLGFGGFINGGITYKIAAKKPV